MTSTSFNVGLNGSTRNSSKVLKPPGGGSSDIFGASTEEQARPKARNHLISSIFGGEETVTPSRNKAGNDSFFNLFGTESQSRPVSAVKDKSKSNISPDQQDNEIDCVKRNLAFTEEKSENNLDSEVKIEGVNIRLEHHNGVKDDESLCDGCQESHPTMKEAISLKVESPGVSDRNPSATETVSVGGASSIAPNPAPTPAPAPASAPTPTAAPAVAPTSGASSKQRVPPGGFSSGLW